MPPLHPIPEVSVSPEIPTEQSTLFWALLFITPTVTILIRIWFPCMTIKALEHQITTFSDYLVNTEKSHLPTESMHRLALSELEYKLSHLKRMCYKIQLLGSNFQRLAFHVWTQPKDVIKLHNMLEKIRSKAMMDIEREKQAVNEYTRRRRRELLLREAMAE